MGALPEEIATASNLEILHLEQNKLTHTVPDIFNRINRLAELKLDHNTFTGTIPYSLFFLQGLSKWF
jgi:Leucine-rich repeat (LRR) protein